MTNLKILTKKEYNDFLNNVQINHLFTETVLWAEFQKVQNNITPYYLGLINEKGEVLATVLLLQKYISQKYSYFQAPNGYIIDYNNQGLVKEMTTGIIKFIKKKKGILLKIKTDNTENINNSLKYLGYKHITSDANISIIKLDRTIEEIKKNLPKSTIEIINEYEKLETELEIGTKKDLEEAYFLIKDNSPSINQKYFETLQEIFGNNEEVKLTIFMEKLNLSKTIKSLEKHLKNINNQISILPIDNLSKNAKDKLTQLTKQKEDIKKEITKYKDIKLEKGSALTINTHMVIEYQKKAWIIYSGKAKQFSEDGFLYSSLSKIIAYYKEKDYKFIYELENNYTKKFNEEVYLGKNNWIIPISKIKYMYYKNIDHRDFINEKQSII